MMASEDKMIIHDFVEVFVFILYVVIMSLLGFYSLFGFGAFTEQNDLFKYFIYTSPMLFFIIFVTFVKIMHHLGKFESVIAFLHDPEYAILGQFRIIKNPLYLLFISIFVFSTIAFLGAILQVMSITEFANFIFPLSPGQEAQQTTAGGKLFFALYTATGENAWGHIVIALLATGAVYLARRFFPEAKVKNILFAASIPISIAFAWIWGAIHALVSGSNQVATLSHQFFGFLSSMLTLLTGSIIPYEVYHLVNNFFVKSLQLFGNEILLVFFGFVFVVNAIVAFFILRSEFAKRAEKQQF